VTALVVLACAIVAILLVVRPSIDAADDRRDELLSTNARLAVSQTGTTLKRGDRTCVDEILLPKGSRVLRVYPGYEAGRRSPRLRFDVRVRGGADLGTAEADRVVAGAPLDVRVAGLRPTSAARVCVRNVGRTAVSLADAREPAGDQPPVRVDVLSGRQRTELAMVPEALDRAGLFKSGLVGSFSLVLLGVLALLAVGGAVVLILRDREDGA
jgi:hypothetical protein